MKIETLFYFIQFFDTKHTKKEFSNILKIELSPKWMLIDASRAAAKAIKKSLKMQLIILTIIILTKITMRIMMKELMNSPKKEKAGQKRYRVP